MQFTTAIIAAACLSLTAAAPQPQPTKCTQQTTCQTAQYDPAPASHVCGVVGTVHLTPTELLGDKKAPTEAKCASSCLKNDDCESFAFDHAARRCLTFRKTPSEMGFHKDPSNTFEFWSAACWGVHCYPTPKCN